jgi:hypothetical protein
LRLQGLAALPDDFAVHVDFTLRAAQSDSSSLPGTIDPFPVSPLTPAACPLRRRRAGNACRRLTGAACVGIISNMKAAPLLDERHVVAANAFVELVVWRLGKRPPGGRHDFKYRLALVVDGRCVLRYDNESGKGDHRRVGKKEHSCVFSTVQRLPDDFWLDVDRWRF